MPEYTPYNDPNDNWLRRKGLAVSGEKFEQWEKERETLRLELVRLPFWQVAMLHRVTLILRTGDKTEIVYLSMDPKSDAEIVLDGTMEETDIQIQLFEEMSHVLRVRLGVVEYR